jgi:Na+/alanine symporter
MKLDAVWSISDTLNGLMSVPNIFALILLSKEATDEMKKSRNTIVLRDK